MLSSTSLPSTTSSSSQGPDSKKDSSRKSLENGNSLVILSATPPVASVELPDPLGLRDRIVTFEQFEQIRKRRNGKKLVEFYQRQNELIEQLLLPITNEPHISEELQRKVDWAVKGSLYVNVILFVLQLLAAVAAGSLALIASMTDSFMDLLSGFILFLTTKSAAKKNFMKYPTGKSRLETVGVLVFSSLMSAVSVQLIVESARTLATKEAQPHVGLFSIVLELITLLAKFFLFLYCYRYRNVSSAPAVLAQDHRNDLMVNSFGLCMGFIASHVESWLDPLGAIIVALLILRSWTMTAWEQTQLIVGKSAEPEFLQKITYISMFHDPRVRQVDTCRAYHAGMQLFVEVDIVMDPETKLKVAHDCGEALQEKLEFLPDVERAFVHVDYEFTHRPEHHQYF